MKKVLIVMMSLEMGGAEKSLVNFLNELTPTDFEIDLMLIKKQGVLMNQLPKWVRIIETPFEIKNLFADRPDQIKGIPYFLARILFSGISKVLFSQQDYNFRRWTCFFTKLVPEMESYYDIAISYLTGESMFYVADKVPAGKKITWVHTDLAVADSCSEDKESITYFPYFDRIITISNQCLESIHQLYVPDRSRLVNLPNIVSAKYIRAMAQKAVQPVYDPTLFNIVSVGRLEQVKGFDMAIEAASIMRDNNIAFRWYIVGDGSERNHLQNMITQYHLENHVVLLGMKENPYPYIAKGDLMVQTSRYEGKSIAVDEAKILGIPILITNYTTAADQITDADGWIVGMCAEEIAAGIQSVIENEESYLRVKQNLQQGCYGNVEEIENYIKYLGLSDTNTDH